MPRKRNPHTTICTNGVPNPERRRSAGPKPNRAPPIAKITHPKTSGLFHRERLFRLLDEYGDAPLTWISAPAGSGKTTLVSSYLENRKLKSIWYRVDERDADIAAFFYYMGLAAKKAAPRKRSPLPLLTPEYFLGIQTFILRYFESLYSRLKPPFRIVLDNYQLAESQSDFHDVIARGAEVVFMAGAHRNGEDDEQGRYAHLISQEGFRIFDAPSQAGVRRIMNKAQVESTWHWFDEKMILQEVQTQRRALQSIIKDRKRRPDVIITDLSQAMSITAELEGVPLVSILNFTWTNHERIRHTPPEYHITTRVCRGLGMAHANECLAKWFGTTTMVLRVLLTWWVKPYNRVRKSLGLRSKRNFFDQMAGDLILMPDFAAFNGMEIDKTALPIGPLTWEPQDQEILTHADTATVQRFQTLLDADTDIPLVYLTMGSTGMLELFKMVIAALKDKPYRLAITTGGRFDIADLGKLPANVCAIPFFPGKRILEKASVTINHGGSGSAYQAMAAQIPQVMIPSHGDQQWNADIVQAEGAGIRLRHRGLTAEKIADAVETLLNKRQPEHN